jgi:lactoylglutathione lyase
MNTEPNIKQTVPFFMVTSMEVSLKFYIDGLGFKLIKQWEPRGKIEWCWLQRDEGVLMLQEHRPGKIAQGKPGADVAIYFQCMDAIALYHEFILKGLKPTKPFVGNNMWVIFVKDPDGFDLSFTSNTNVPEETKYADWEKRQ